MRQVPAFSSFLIIGRGRVARHLRHFFELSRLPFQSWDRTQPLSDLHTKSRGASHILLAISDSAIEGFAHDNSELFARKQLVHFSGALVSKRVPGAHPLMTFSHDLYDLEAYRSMAFVTEKDREPLEDLLPGLCNSSFAIESEQKGLYHALCVLSGNFSVILWEKAFRDFEEKLGIPRDALKPYLERTFANLAATKSGASVLTGPLARGDQMTIEKNLFELRGDPFRDVYAAFVKAYSGANK
jgi:predicted short-subunit dehydrogenase-like oxidoreductase (DUF2520 family)